ASHLYTAVVFKGLLLHPHGFYASVYRFQPRLVTNWASLVLLSIISSIFSAAHAEQVLTTGLAITAFLCFVYFRRSVDASSSALDPITNFLINTWFFWIGFYNFYLGIALCLLLAGFYIRRVHSFDRRDAVKLGAGLTILFFVHVLPAA